MGNWGLSLFLVAALVMILIYQAQTRLRDKMLCYFVRPNRQMIEKWVPLYSREVVFDRGKYGVAQYTCDPACIVMMWYTRGINKLFPVLVPTLMFKFDTPNPLDPKTFQATWSTPEARNASWQEHQHTAFAKAALAQAGVKRTMLDRFFPLIMVGLLIIVLFIVWKGQSGLDHRLFDLEQAIKGLTP